MTISTELNYRSGSALRLHVELQLSCLQTVNKHDDGPLEVIP
jgi:hypothetical protein